MKRIALAVLFVALLLTSGLAVAQETRATLTGRVTDPTGAIIPGAQITVTQTTTGTVTHIVSNHAGVYNAPFLQPGPYSIAVSAPGFQNYLHRNLVLETEQTVVEDVTLKIGETTQTVTVNAETPLVDTADASTGQTLTSEEVEDLPANGRSPLGFAHLEYGAVAKGKHAESQTTPFGNSTADDFSLGGGASASNELLLNGVPNMQDSSRTAGFSPELDAVDAVHVDEFSANAALGDTSGGTVNITTKSGTNQFHGTASEYYAGSRPLTAEPYFTPAGSTVPSTHFNQFAGTIGGPVWIPHVFNGKNRLFFFYAFEGYIGNAPATTITSVPTQAERNGDFSALLNVTASDQLYNPYSGTLSGSQVVRTEIPGNVFSNASLSVDPVAAAYLKLIPLPNYNGPSTKPDGENNYFASDPTTNNYKSNEGRMDFDVSANNRLSFEEHESKYVNGQSNIFNNALSGTSSSVVLWGGFLEDVDNFTPSMNLDVRLGLSRSENSSNPNSSGISPTTMGFPSYLAANSTAPAIPYITFSDSAAIPSLSAEPGNRAFFDTIQLFATLSKTWGHHTFKIGPDIRANKDSTLSPSGANGAFTFKSATGDVVTSGSTGAAQAFGGALALFELGLPVSSSTSFESIATPLQYDNWYIGTFAQDDWKVLPNLTISMGIRVEHETPVVESNNRMIAGFNPTAVNAVTSSAAAAYAANPNPILPVSDFSATGGLYYATSSDRSGYHTATAYVSPRIGFAYSPGFSNGKLAIRGGFGIYDNPFNDYNFGQAYGYSASTAYVPSTLATEIPTSTLSHPFDSGVNPIVQPVGDALGVNTNLGSGAIFYPGVKVPYTEKWSLDVEKQVGRSFLFEVGYLGTHAVHLSYSNALSSAPLLPYLSHSPTADPAVTAELSAKTTNPFYGLLPAGTSTTSLNTSTTISVAQLLQSYPEYSSVTQQLVPGQTANFNAFMFRIEKRMSQGLQFNFNYEHSRLLGAQSQLNAGGPLWYGETTSDFPNHVAVTAIYQLPFGRGRRFANNSRILDEIIGGYEVTGIYQYLSGTPIQWGTNVVYTGNYSGFNNNPHNTNGPSFNTSGFDRVAADQPNSYNFRTFSEYLLRSDPNNNFDFSLLKNFSIGDRVVIQPRIDAFNAFNHPQFSSANVSPTSSSFADVTSQLNAGRDLQGGIHILF
ncbi:MAG TPA: carboxypeptidase-like regulatory domain-containing protein [Acidobacteriaceae bacterium]|nr:carboxypeptidase-like regulatory domain-containing protein [Acidobacteriaceae bacterium]